MPDVGQSADLNPGDLLLVKHPGLLPMLIRWGQGRLRHEYSWPNHAAVVTGPDTVVEALVHVGVVRSSYSQKYERKIPHAVVDVGATPEQRALVVAFAEHCVGRRYGLAEDVCLALYCLTRSKVRFGLDNQMICSALAAEALCRTAAIFADEPLWCMPNGLAAYYDVKGPSS